MAPQAVGDLERDGFLPAGCEAALIATFTQFALEGRSGRGLRRVRPLA